MNSKPAQDVTATLWLLEDVKTYPGVAKAPGELAGQAFFEGREL